MRQPGEVKSSSTVQHNIHLWKQDLNFHEPVVMILCAQANYAESLGERRGYGSDEGYGTLVYFRFIHVEELDPRLRFPMDHNVVQLFPELLRPA